MSKVAPIKDLEKEINTLEHPEKKLRIILDKMKSILSHSDGIDFKFFWEANDIVLLLFKESIPAHQRNILWNEYREMRDQVQLIKKHQGEQSVFAAEQFKLAIADLEKKEGVSLNKEEECLLQNINSVDILKAQREFYKNAIQDNKLLTSRATRINALRKELTASQPQGRWRKEIFDKLSKIGDEIFPKRRELIAQTSQSFQNDVQSFVQKNFYGQKQVDSNKMRHAIQAFQGLAKLLPLNTTTFKTTRAALSGSWDALNVMDQKSREEKNELLAQDRSEFDVMKEALNVAVQLFKEKSGSVTDLEKQLETFEKAFSAKRFSKDIFKEGKKLISDVKSLVYAEYDKVKEEHIKKSEELKKKREQAYQSALQLLEECSKDVNEKSVASLEDSLEKNILSSDEVEFLQVHLDLYKEKLLLDKEALNRDLSLEKIKADRQERRKKAKIHLDKIRQKSAGSGMDFAMANHLAMCLQIVKERIALIDEALSK